MCRCNYSSTRLDWVDHESMVLLLMLNGVANYQPCSYCIIEILDLYGCCTQP